MNTGKIDGALGAEISGSSGLAVDMRDTFIAGIALARGATLATRNTRHFRDLAVAVVDPWARP